MLGALEILHYGPVCDVSETGPWQSNGATIKHVIFVLKIKRDNF